MTQQYHKTGSASQAVLRLYSCRVVVIVSRYPRLDCVVERPSLDEVVESQNLEICPGNIKR